MRASRRAKPSPFRPAARAQPGRSEYDQLPAEMRRDYAIGMEIASERLTRELNITRLAFAVVLDRMGGEVMIGEADLQRVSGRRIVSDEADIGTGSWVFRLHESKNDA